MGQMAKQAERRNGWIHSRHVPSSTHDLLMWLQAQKVSETGRICNCAAGKAPSAHTRLFLEHLTPHSKPLLQRGFPSKLKLWFELL